MGFGVEKIRKRISKPMRRQIREKCGGRCGYCGDVLGDRFVVDHIAPVVSHWIPEAREKVNDPSNLMPSCAPCNNFKTVFDLETFRAQIESQVERGRKYSVNFRFAEKFGLIEVTRKPVRFYFETLCDQSQNNEE